MILAVTGHRPDKLGGWHIPNPVFDIIVERMDKALMELQPDIVITGMSLGVDQWMAELCIENDIPFWAAVPFEGQANVWPEHSQARYYEILEHAAKIMNVSPGPYERSKMHIRNRWMVKHCDLLLAVWDGSSGGTRHCVNSALEIGRKIIRVHVPKFVPSEPIFSAPPVMPKKQLQFQMGGGIGNFDDMKNPCGEIPLTDLLQASLLKGPPAAAPKPPQWKKVTAVVKTSAMPAVPSQKREEEPEEKKPYQRFVDLSD
jgi:uncharacterized phage-like protein YoqJ